MIRPEVFEARQVCGFIEDAVAYKVFDMNVFDGDEIPFPVFLVFCEVSLKEGEGHSQNGEPWEAHDDCLSRPE